MDQRRVHLLIAQGAPLTVHSRINEHTPAARGKVFGPADRLMRDAIGEKLYQIWKNSVQARREAGIRTGPFEIKDWMR